VILYGDCRDHLDDLETGVVQLVFTSPPYFGQRRYGDDPEHEIGWGSIDNYLTEMGQVLDQLHRVTDTDATVWFVIGDKRAGSGGAGGDHTKAGKTKGSKTWIPHYGKPDYGGLATGQAMMVPFLFAQTAQQRGWLVRSMITWDKSPNVKPEDPKHINRPMTSTEIIVLLAKHTRHRWHPGRLVEKADVWHVKPHRGSKAARHYAPFPGELPERGILAASDRGDVILDPFGGSHTTARVAADLGRRAISIELYEPEENP
jgi:DNA modification methylase